MLKNFFRSAFRRLLRNRLYTFMNIIGLSVGLACFAMIGMWVKHQYSYDQMHGNAQRIFQVNESISGEREKFRQAITAAPLAAALISECPEIDRTLRLDLFNAVVQHGAQQFVEKKIIGADPSFFAFFDFRLLKGQTSTALSEPYSVVISERTAKKYFGERDPLNESLRIFQFDPDGKGAEYKVTGIIEDAPANSHFDYAMIISFSTIEVAKPELLTTDGWQADDYYTYVMLKPAASRTLLESKFSNVLQKYRRDEIAVDGSRHEYFLTALTDIHFGSDIKNQISASTSKLSVMIFGLIGLAVLVLACINYVSLSTAFSIAQFTGVGIRRVLGASGTHVIMQGLAESWLVAVVAMLASIVWVELATPLFESLFGIQLAGLYNMQSLLTLFGLASLTGICSGIYPSLILASFQTVRVLKGQVSRGTSAASARKTLVVIQYSITVVLISCIFVVHYQLDYIGDKNLGFENKNLLLFGTNGSPEVIPGYGGFANELLANQGVVSISRSNTGIGGGGLDKIAAVVEDAEGRRLSTEVYTIGVDHDYIGTYQMSMIAGRNFIAGNPYDSSKGFIINEAAALAYGYRNPKDALGKFFSLNGRMGEVIGVVENFHYATLREKIEPTALFLLNGYFSRITVRMENYSDDNITFITGAWKKHFPASVVDFLYTEDGLQGSYKSEKRFAKIFLIFSTLSLLIASLGIFSLVSYNVERRTKEIGMRKVLGGTVTEITALLSKEFLVLVILASVLAIPVAWYLMDRWLQNFAYHVNLGPGVFLLATLVSVAVAMGVVSLKTVRSAQRNPADALRAE